MARSIRSVLALTFIVAGIASVAGGQSALGMFEQIGLGQWLRYATGFSAISSGLLLLIPAHAVAGAAIATAMSLGALLVQAFLLAGSPTVTVILAFLSGGSLVHAQLDQPVATHRR